MAAFTIESELRPTLSPIKELFEFISDFRNFQSLLPHDKIEDFKFSANECSFVIKGVTSMKVQMAEKKPFEYILFSSDGLGKFNFRLKVFFFGKAEEKGECRIELQGDVNPFIKAMAEKPLGQLVNTISIRLAELELTSS